MVVVILGAVVAAASESVRIDVDRRDTAAAPDRAMDGVHMVVDLFPGRGAPRRFVSGEESTGSGLRRACGAGIGGGLGRRCVK